MFGVTPKRDTDLTDPRHHSTTCDLASPPVGWGKGQPSERIAPPPGVLSSILQRNRLGESSGQRWPGKTSPMRSLLVSDLADDVVVSEVSEVESRQRLGVQKVAVSNCCGVTEARVVASPMPQRSTALVIRQPRCRMPLERVQK